MLKKNLSSLLNAPLEKARKDRPQKIVLATNNPGKVKELQFCLNALPIDGVAQSALDVPDAAETGHTFIENALIKAQFASQKTGLSAIADDSGLVVDALQGAPGIYSARYAGENASSEANISKLLSDLEGVPWENRTARFYCVLVFLKMWDDPLPLIAEGLWEGQILFEPHGTQGFGYDPIFYVPTHQCSAAELSPEEKMKISHRGKALQALIKKLTINFLSITDFKDQQ